MAEIVKGILPSRALRREVPYNVVLPESYAATKKRFPVLYVLHGLFGTCDNWIELTDLASQADAHELIVITPEGSDGWYVDSVTDRREKFEKYILKDLVPRVDDLFRTRAQRRSRGIAGNSMGGYGAIKFALKRPDLFAFAASSSGAFQAPSLSEETADERWKELVPSIYKAFGAPTSRRRRSDDLTEIASRFDRDTNELPALFIDCGVEDSFLEVNRDLSRRLAACGISHSYEEFSGGHGWDYWNGRIRDIFRRAGETLD